MTSRFVATLALALLSVAATRCSDDAGAPSTPPATDEFSSSSVCGGCHPLQVAEWRGSIMSYAAVSPVFNAFELTMRETSNGLVAADGPLPSFCARCHSPVGERLGELPRFAGASPQAPVIAGLSPLAAEAITCDLCHTVKGPDRAGSLEGDGIANLALTFEAGATKRGPIDDPGRSAYHLAASIDYLESSEFCGACHDVRVPKADTIAGTPTQRVENLFTEWRQSSYAARSNRFQRVVSCQDCHMSLYPMAPPGTYPQATVAIGGLPGRRHALHAFTAVSIPLIEDPRFPNVTSTELDEFGFPVGQAERRVQMLRAACTLGLEETPATLAHDAATIPIRVRVENVGAGHRVPAGFSQEREMWIALTVRDDDGVLYESGQLHDRAHPETGELTPDGNLDDEDLEDKTRDIAVEDWRVSDEPGPDRDQRPEHELGLVSFQNAFLAKGAHEGELKEIVSPLLADGIDGRRSLAPNLPARFAYDVPRPARPIHGAIRVEAKLRFRTLPPYLVRVLARRHPELVTEAMLDRNTIVDMAEATTTITAAP